MSVIAPPNVKLLVVEYLREVPEVAALGGVGTRLSDTPTWPFLVVRRVGGPRTAHGWIDHARIQVDAFDGGPEEEGGWTSDARAVELAGLANSALLRLCGVRGDAVVSGVTSLGGLQELPDIAGSSSSRGSVVVATRHRVMFEVMVHVHPARAGN